MILEGKPPIFGNTHTDKSLSPIEAKDMIARAKVPTATAPWPPQTSSKPKPKVNYQLQQHGDGFSVRHPVLGEVLLCFGSNGQDDVW